MQRKFHSVLGTQHLRHFHSFLMKAERSFSDRASDIGHQHKPYLCHLPSRGSSWVLLLPLTFMLAQGTAAPWPMSTVLPSKQEDLWCKLETKKNTKNPPRRVQRHEVTRHRMRWLKTDFSACPRLLYAWSHLAGFCRGKYSLDINVCWFFSQTCRDAQITGRSSLSLAGQKRAMVESVYVTFLL